MSTRGMTVPWRTHVDATTAGAVEHMLTKGRTGKPVYGARNLLINALLKNWLARELRAEEPPVPTLDELLKHRRS